MSGRSSVRHAASIALVALLVHTSMACAGAEGLRRRKGPGYVGETASWLQVVEQHGGPGMWLVVRGYHTSDDFIALATNAPLSHAVVLDSDRGEVIEAVGDGVRVTALAKLLSESHRIQLIRPKGWTLERGVEAVQKARSQVGHGYDFLGIVGAPDRNRWYCSELVVWSMGVRVNKAGAWNVIHPKDLHRKGELLFDSRARDGLPDGLPDGVEAAPSSAATRYIIIGI
jgi:hypothetical protein